MRGHCAGTLPQTPASSKACGKTPLTQPLACEFLPMPTYLSTAQLEAYRRDGFLVLPEFASAEACLKIRAQGYTVLLIEHDMNVVMKISDRIAVLDFGKKIAEGLPEEMRNNPDVIAAYLGVPDDAA